VAEITALPFADATFDLAAAGFVVNHVADPVAALGELARVTVPGGAVLATAFAEYASPRKEAVDDVLRAAGWVAPDWYRVFKARADALSDARAFERAAQAAGLTGIAVSTAHVDVGLDDPADVVRYRFGMPQVTSFLDRLTPGDCAAVEAAAVAAVGDIAEAFHPRVMTLVSRVASPPPA